MFPVTTSGSWPRSTALIRALRGKQSGELSDRDFDAIADKEVIAPLRYRNEKEIGLYVVNPRTDEIVARVKDILQYFDPDKVYLNPDCGFGTFAERNVNTPEIAEMKLLAMSQAAVKLRAEYG